MAGLFFITWASWSGEGEVEAKVKGRVKVHYQHSLGFHLWLRLDIYNFCKIVYVSV